MSHLLPSVLLSAAFLALAPLSPLGGGAAVQALQSVQEDPADAAWRAGDTARALALYRARLEANPRDGVALHRVALIRAWDGAYDEALQLLDRLLEFQPENLDARVDRARVQAWRGDLAEAIGALDALLGEHPGYTPALAARATFETWAGRHDASLATYRTLLAAAPDDVEARLGVARVLMLKGDRAGAVAAFEDVLEDHPAEVRALQGLGQALSWEGELRRGEAFLRRAVALDSTGVSSLTGLAQNLRWQGRNAAALEVLERALALAPQDGDVLEQRRWVHATLGPQVHPSVALEGDSDDNRMLTTALMARWHPLPRLGIRADAYRRSLEQNALERTARGLAVSASWQTEPGWTISAGLGASEGDGAGETSFTAWNVGVGSPGRYPVSASLTAASGALDASALLVERGVRLTEVGATARWTPSPAWTLSGSLGRAAFEGRDTNHRTSLSAEASRRVDRLWTVGAAVRSFGFDRDVADGYFDPDFYGIAELTGRWLWEPGTTLSLLAEVAPGVQQIGEGSDPSGTLRATGRLALRMGPGRELSLRAVYSSNGLQAFASGASDYRYTAVVVGGSWVF